MAGSVDSHEDTTKLAEKLGLDFPVAWGLDAETVCKLTGGFYEGEKKFIQPANFLLRPDRTIAVASYSNGPIGRFSAKNALDLIKYFKDQDKS